jgi:hypothetical protein
MNKIFGANYATVFINKGEKKIKIVWKGLLTSIQFKLVLELVLEQVEKYNVEVIAEDRSKLRLQNQKEFERWLQTYFLPKISTISRYIIKDYPSSSLKNILPTMSILDESKLKILFLSNHQEFESAFNFTS